MKIKITVSTNKIKSESSKIVELDEDDDLTDAEIDEIAEQELFNMISWDWERVE